MKDISRVIYQTSIENDVNGKHEFQNKRKTNYVVLYSRDLKKIRREAREINLKNKVLKIDVSSDCS